MYPGRFRTHLDATLRLLAIAAVALAIVIYVTVSAWNPKAVLIRQWQLEWDSLPQSQLQIRCYQLSELGDEGILALTEAVCHERANVAKHATESLYQMLVRGKEQRDPQSVRRARFVANALAQRANRFAPEAAGDLHRLAKHLLTWSNGLDHDFRLAWLADCQTVLDATRSEWNPAMQDDRFIVADPQQDDHSDATPQVATPSPSGPVGSNTLASPHQAPTQPLVASDDAKSSGDDSAEPSTRSPTASLDPKSPPQRIRRPSEELPLRPVGPNWRQWKPHELLKLLGEAESGSETDTMVVNELRRRGFSELQIAVGRKTFDPDPNVRGRMVRELPRLPLDARPWLLWLSADPDASVSRAAIRMIETSSDPELLSHLQERTNDTISGPDRRR